MHDFFDTHKIVKEIGSVYRKPAADILRDEDGKIVKKTEEELVIWKNYINRLFEDTRT